ncbi:fibroblast growth factor receptor homolog 1-like isoform X2 [Salminus brasiliensis]|uniref:fibroblast growth factor receptor homolog 1-like isoform X2 n=1 Tax=Salminus brasiliensis TaxID=930266 RepID=UPI003B8363ED
MAFNYSQTEGSHFTTAGNEKDKCEKKDIDGLMLYIIIIASAFFLVIIGMALMWLKTYKTLIRTIRNLQDEEQRGQLTPPAPEADHVQQISSPEQNLTVKLGPNILSTTEAKSQSTKVASRSLRRPTQMDCRFNKADLNLHQLIKAGREGVFYKAKMMHGTIKGHNIFTCKISKKGCNRRQVEREVSVMQKLGTHKNLLQLLEWDITDTPYMLVMEYVAHGTLRSFLQLNQNRLCLDKELQHLFTLAAYHIAHAMKHLRSKMILHCDLALRNIMVHSFPHEVKVAEFGLAREVARTWSRRGSCKKDCKERIPSRWYPPEYFKNDYYGFKGDVWAFGIVLWEMETFGTLPYPNLNTSEEVARYVCAGHRNGEPDQCRPEMLQMMKDCWQEPYSLRPSFMDIVEVLENILENDRDYVDMDDRVNQRNQSASVQPEDSDTVIKTDVYCNESQS